MIYAIVGIYLVGLYFMITEDQTKKTPKQNSE